MATFTIDSENNIVVQAGTPASSHNLQQAFATEKELAKLAGEWPASRLLEVWNSFAGVAPFDDLKPVKKFTNRQTAVRRIWQAVTRLSPALPPQAKPTVPTGEEAQEAPAKSKKRASARKGADESQSNKKAEVIAMMKRPNGATLAEIMEATGWQQHTVRGFVSILGSKGGEKIESARNADGARTYKIAK